AITQEEGAVRVRYQLQDDEASRVLWPHAFVATMEFLLGKDLQLEFSVRNTGDTALTFSFALHSYFPVRDIRQCRVTGLEETGFIDQLQDNARCPAEQQPIRFERETDRIYTGASGRYDIHDEATGRRIHITAPDCRSAIVWNPWQDKTARLADMAPEAWEGMVCVECGNVGPDEVRLEPGEIRRFRLHLEQSFHTLTGN
ncbi:MAG TPA: D-hexose-6-phosphate mutarotase, partial [Moraxellaceae bacterium]